MTAGTRDIDIPEYRAVADELITAGKAEASTMMGHPCLRRDGAFFATARRERDELILKLSESRVRQLIDEGIGRPFAPAGKVFRAWVTIPHDRAGLWGDLIREAWSAAAPTLPG